MRVAAVAAAIAWAEVPVTPDRDTARRWLVEELARPEYDTSPSLLERFLAWFIGLFEDIGSVGTPDWTVLAVLSAAVALVILVARWVTGPVRLARRARSSAVVSDDDDLRTATQLREAADTAARRGDWALAVAERFRAVVRSLEERTVLDERPGRTSQEAAADAADRVPDEGRDLALAATLFDGVVYGHRQAGEVDDAFLRTLDARLAAARVLAGSGAGHARGPMHPDGPGGPGGSDGGLT